MSTRAALTLEEAITESGESWIVDLFEPREQAIQHVRQTLASVGRLAESRLGKSAPNLSEQAVVEEFARNPERVRAFFQTLGGSHTPEMLLMVWRIMQGMEIESIELDHRRQQRFHVRVVLVSPYGEEDPPYESSEITDFAIFRHIGVLLVNNRPVFDGFYPLRLS